MTRLAKVKENQNVISKQNVKNLLIKYKDEQKIHPELMAGKLKNNLNW